MSEQSSSLVYGGEENLMTDAQYKGLLFDQMNELQEILELAIAAGNKEIQEKAEKRIAQIKTKLKF